MFVDGGPLGSGAEEIASFPFTSCRYPPNVTDDSPHKCDAMFLIARFCFLRTTYRSFATRSRHRLRPTSHPDRSVFGIVYALAFSQSPSRRLCYPYPAQAPVMAVLRRTCRIPAARASPRRRRREVRHSTESDAILALHMDVIDFLPFLCIVI